MRVERRPTCCALLLKVCRLHKFGFPSDYGRARGDILRGIAGECDPTHAQHANAAKGYMLTASFTFTVGDVLRIGMFIVFFFHPDAFA